MLYDDSHPTGLLELTNEQYHSGPGLSKSKLDAIAVSPLNFWDQFVSPDREPREEKHCFRFGSGAHSLTLEPDQFDAEFAIGFDKSAHPEALDSTADLKEALKENGLKVSGTKPELIARLKEAGYNDKPIMADLEAAHIKTMGNREALTAIDYKHLRKMVEAISGHHTASGLIKDCKVEQSFYWRDALGVLRKCRPDIVTADGKWLVDLKTTDDVSQHGFGSTIVKRRYEVQAAWYLDILHALYGSDAPTGFAFIAIQKNRPYDCAVHYLEEWQIERGRRLYQRDLEVLRDCFEYDCWFGADNGEVLKAQFPRWAVWEEENA